MTLTDAINIFIQQSINVQGLPLLAAADSKNAMKEQAKALPPFSFLCLILNDTQMIFKTKDPKSPTISNLGSIDPVREKIRTPDTLVRSQVLYPAELHAHIQLKRNARDRDRTGTVSPQQDFKSCASASSATRASASWTFGDSNPGPTGYEPVALTN